MAQQLGTALRDGLLDAVETLIGTAPKVEIRTGAKPSAPGDADSGTLLATFTLDSDWASAASGGSKAGTGLPKSTTGLADGVAGHYRIKNNAGSVVHYQGAIAGEGVTIDNANIATGQTVNLTALTLAIGGA